MKQIITNYTFNATAKTVTLTDFTTVRLDRLQLIVDVTGNTILYNFADSSIATATVATNVITLSTVGSAASADKLQIVYDCLAGDPTYDNVAKDGTDASGVTAPTGAAGIRGWLSGIYNVLSSAWATVASAVPTKGLFIGGTDGTNFRALGVDSSNRVTAKLADSFGNSISQQTPGDTQSAAPTAVLGVSSFALDFNGTNYVRKRGDTNGSYTHGNVAHDAADAGNPVKVGAKATAALSGATLVAAADRTDAVADLDGALLVRTDRALNDLVNGNASNTDGTSTAVIAAQGAGVKTYLTDFTIANLSSTNTYCEIKDGAVVKWTVPVPANGGVTHHFASPIPGSANTAWNFDMGTAVTTAYASFSGYKSKV